MRPSSGQGILTERDASSPLGRAYRVRADVGRRVHAARAAVPRSDRGLARRQGSVHALGAIAGPSRAPGRLRASRRGGDRVIASPITLLVAGLVWAALTFSLWRSRRWLSFYVTGAFGFVLLALSVARTYGLDATVEVWQARQVTALASLVGIRLGSLGGSGLAIQNHTGWAVFDVGIECSALLEMSAMVGLIVFYPAFSAKRKVANSPISRAGMPSPKLTGCSASMVGIGRPSACAASGRARGKGGPFAPISPRCGSASAPARAAPRSGSGRCRSRRSRPARCRPGRRRSRGSRTW